MKCKEENGTPGAALLQQKGKELKQMMVQITLPLALQPQILVPNGYG